MDPEILPPPPPYSRDMTVSIVIYGSLMKTQDANLSEPSFCTAEIGRPTETPTYHFDFSPSTVPSFVPFSTLRLTGDVEIKD